MSNLRKIKDEERESQFGRVYAVSGPGKFCLKIISVFPMKMNLRNILQFHSL